MSGLSVVLVASLAFIPLPATGPDGPGGATAPTADAPPAAVGTPVDGQGREEDARQPAAPIAPAGVAPGNGSGQAIEPREAHSDRARAPSLSDFPGHLATGLRNLVSPESLRSSLIGAGIAGGAMLLDEEVEHHIADRFEAVGEVGEVAGNHIIVGGGIAGLLVIGQTAGHDGFRSLTFDLAQGYLLNNAVTYGLKYGVQRERPNGENTRSFPSGHASNAFAWATILQRHLGLKAGVPAYAFATFIAMTRLEENAHFTSDVVAGAVVGVLVGNAVTRHLDEVGELYVAGHRVTWSPQVVPGGVMIGLGVDLR